MSETTEVSDKYVMLKYLGVSRESGTRALDKLREHVRGLLKKDLYYGHDSRE